MSLDYHFTVEQEVGSATHAFFGFNGICIFLFYSLRTDIINSIVNNIVLGCSRIGDNEEVIYALQARQVFGELVPSMRQEDGKTGQQWKTWILLSVPVLGAGNLST